MKKIEKSYEVVDYKATVSRKFGHCSVHASFKM